MNAYQHFFEQIEKSKLCSSMPTKYDAHHFIDELVDFLFPFRKNTLCTHSLPTQWLILQDKLAAIVKKIEGFEENTNDYVTHFFDQLPSIYKKLQADAEAILTNDPAARSLEEVILAYPGFYAIAVYRIANLLYLQRIPTLPRLLSEYAHSQTGIDIHPGATVGNAFFIDHGTGIVIGETTIIGDYVKIYQGVTLGALTVKKAEADIKRHPTIENNVTIYANATILGGKTIIGEGSLIGGNVFLTESVPSQSTVYQKSEINIRSAKSKI